MKKSTLNFLIDALMFISLCAITGIGLLIKYTLPSGQDKWAIYGTNNDFLFLNLDRHQWGDIHFVISIVMLVLLILHIVLHWQFITSIFGRLFQFSTLKVITGSAFGIIAIVLITFPFLISPTEVESRHSLQQAKLEPVNKTVAQPSTTNATDMASENAGTDLHNNHTHQYEVNGQMTLAEVANAYNIPVSTIVQKLNIDGADKNERLGRLRKQYGFNMSDIEKIISNYHE